MKYKVKLSDGEFTEWDDEVESQEEMEKFIRRLGLHIISVEQSQETHDDE